MELVGVFKAIVTFVSGTSVSVSRGSSDDYFKDSDGITEIACIQMGREDFETGSGMQLHLHNSIGNKKRSPSLVSAYIKGYTDAYVEFYDSLFTQRNTPRE